MSNSVPVLYCELGLGEIEYWVFGDPIAALGSKMRIDESYRTCVGYLEVNGKIIGTCCFVSVPLSDNRDITQAYLVTAKHNVYDRITKQVTNGLSVRINRRGGDSVPILLQNNWVFPPESDLDVDVAILPFERLDRELYDWSCIPYQAPHLGGAGNAVVDQNTIDLFRIAVGNDIRIVGLHIDISDMTRNVPIVRGGIISAMPTETIKFRIHGEVIKFKAHLIEVQSIGGLSGCPVFVLADPSPKTIEVGARYGLVGSGHKSPRPFLLGILRGRRDITNEVYKADMDYARTGITFVTPSTDILGLLYGTTLMKQREKTEAERLKKSVGDLIEDSFTSNEFTQESFEASLKKASRQISEREKEPKETSK